MIAGIMPVGTDGMVIAQGCWEACRSAPGPRRDACRSHSIRHLANRTAHPRREVLERRPACERNFRFCRASTGKRPEGCHA